MNAPITVAICTKDRPAQLQQCLRSLTPLRGSDVEILIVDNGSGQATRDVAQQFQARYVQEPRVGLCAARNCAIQHAAGEIIAFTDDDCEVDPAWLAAIRRGFGTPEIGCVTGRVVSPPTVNWVQEQFHKHTMEFFWPQSFRVDPADLTWNVFRAVAGVGGNMAYRRDLLRRIGGFPEMLRDCSDEVYMFVRVLRAGYSIQYVPDSVVCHHHRTELADHLRRFFQYGYGAVRMIARLSREDSSSRLFILNTSWFAAQNGLRLVRSIVRLRPAHAMFVASQLAGVAWGSFVWSARLILRRDA